MFVFKNPVDPEALRETVFLLAKNAKKRRKEIGSRGQQTGGRSQEIGVASSHAVA
jgi:hypothetical protein